MTACTSPTRPCLTFIASLALLGVATLYPSSSSRADTQGCELVTDPAALATLIGDKGLRPFENPPRLSAPPTSEATRLDLIVDYADITVAGCPTHLRTYNNQIVGPTIRARPGDTLYIRLINNLHQPDTFPNPPQQPPPAGHSGGEHTFSFNITNLHTHGLHVAPQGPVDPKTGKVPFESDNVLIELRPGDQQDYRIRIPLDHPAGTFWYHAHVHGSTAVQLSSGMAGALIIEGGTRSNGDLDAVPAIGQVKDHEKIFVLQQLAYDTDGKLEKFSFLTRPTLVNGQLVPVIHMQPGEVQRWRFVHAGVGENIALALDDHPIYEVAADGISLGRSVPWAATPASNAGAEAHTLFLFPGYRSDVLVQAQPPTIEPGGKKKRIFLRKLDLPPSDSIQVQERMIARAAAALPGAADVFNVPPDPADFVPGQILAELVVDGTPVRGQTLPTADELKDVVPTALRDIGDDEIDNAAAPQAVEFRTGKAHCDPVDGFCVQPCTGTDCQLSSFQINHMQFSMTPRTPLVLNLNTNGKPTAAEWTISTMPGVFHPFHIHVNPFQLTRDEPNGSGTIVSRPVWKDTIGVRKPLKLRMRYTDFKGTFVLHCHILQHEDQGMMQLVKIVD
jgi:FtsP/CotA-like multicopper oxidase with cupredoxin domain